MRFKVNELPTFDEPFAWEVAPSSIALLLAEDDEHDDFNKSLYFAADPFSVDIFIHRSEDDVFFHGKAQGSVGFTCVRTLQRAKVDLDLTLGGFFRPRRPGDPEQADEPSCFLYAGDEIDFSPVLREEIFLQLPMNPTLDDASFVFPEEDSDQSEPLEVPPPSPPPQNAHPDPRWEGLRQIHARLASSPRSVTTTTIKTKTKPS